MYLFDPDLLQIVMAIVAALAAAYLAAWLVAGTTGPFSTGEGDGDEVAAEPGPEGEELETRKKFILWTAASAALLFLLWWATLSAGSGGRPML